jgi:lipopolysaccharide transport system ATP-binding protein
MNTVLEIAGISKKYRIGGDSKPYLTLTDALKTVLTFKSPKKETIWALEDVSFDVKQGESIGIVGKNGAGKSTLLRILSRITSPTSGIIRANGRVASLLEVGTGFHLELSGRENVYLNGSILGMKKNEIDRKFDEIVDFSGVEQFLDTPIKHYSSGMQLRLAFAVAAHLDPEILMIDEVLAVGDAEFQKKCLGKMAEVTQEGRTIIFVSHNMTALQNLCTRGIYLKGGKKVGEGEISEVINGYLGDLSTKSDISTEKVKIRSGVHIEEFSFSPNPVETGQACEFNLRLGADEVVQVVDLSILIYNSLGMRAGILDLRSVSGARGMSPGSPLTLSGRVNNLNLVEGEYQIGLFMNANNEQANYLDQIRLTVNSKPTDGVLPYPAGNRGLVELDFQID